VGFADDALGVLERTGFCSQRVQRGAQAFQHLLVEAGADVAGVTERALLVMNAE
jgi:hypothetical protein